MSLTEIEGPPPTLPFRSMRLAIVSLLLLCLFGLFATRFGQTGTPGLELFPKHFRLHPGEQIHYQVWERSENSQLREPSH